MLELIRFKLLALNVDKRAVTAVEYALMAGLIAVAIVAAVNGLAGSIKTTLNSVSSAL
jgi:pilus assembly protein Flp/PilA